MKAVLTGHSRGLGAALAEALLARGASVLALSRHRHPARAAPQRLVEVALDLADATALARWLDSGELCDFLAGDEPALLVNNAGMLQPVGPAGTQDIATIARAVALNVAAPLMLSSAFVAASSAATERRIMHVSSGAGRAAYPGWSIYCATKAALDHHARALALDRIPSLRISSLAPGVIDTDMQAEIRAVSPERFPLREKFVALKQQNQLAAPHDAAGRIVDYLLSERFGEAAVTDLRELSNAVS